MNQSVPDFEQRLSNLQAQMDRLRDTPPGDLDPAEQRLALLTDQCAEIVRRWAVTSERHARAVSRFEAHLTEWNDAGNKLQQDASQRIQELEKVVQGEWEDLRQLHEEPVRQLHEHAASLTQVCIATANAAQQNFERSEARLAAIEGEFTRRMTELTREIQAVVAELRADQSSRHPKIAAPTQAWPLEGVTRLHNQLRQTEDVSPVSVLEVPAAAPAQPRPVAGLLSEAASALTERIETLERTATEREASIRETLAHGAPSTRAWRVAAAVLVVLVALSGIFTWQLRGRVQDATARVDKAERDARAATETASREVAATQAEAAREIRAAVERAAAAQTIANVLAAPDLIRYNLIGQDSMPGASAQVHWSRSRGMVFSGSRIPVPPTNARYQIWLLTRGGAINAAPFVPDPAGVATVSIAPPQVPRAVIGAIVTLEPAAGSLAPTGDAVLARAPALSVLFP